MPRREQAGRRAGAFFQARGRRRLPAPRDPRFGGPIRVHARAPSQRRTRAVRPAHIPRPAQARAPVAEPPIRRSVLLLVLHPRGRIRARPAIQRRVPQTAGLPHLAGVARAGRGVPPGRAQARAARVVGLGPRTADAAVRVRGVRRPERRPCRGALGGPDLSVWPVPFFGSWSGDIFTSSCPDWAQMQSEFIGWTLDGGPAKIQGS